MARKFFKKYMPHPSAVLDNKWLGFLGPRLHDPSLWHLNRRSCAGGLALGMFCTFIPLPLQMAIAAIGALIFRVNVLIAVPTVWISNPITIPPIFYFCYVLGSTMLSITPEVVEFQLSWGWLSVTLGDIWLPLLLGCLTAATVTSVAAYFLVHILWRLHIISHLKERRQKRLRRLAAKRRSAHD